MLQGAAPWPLRARVGRPHPDEPYTFDLRRMDLGKPMPRTEDWAQ